jgi:hypothetical protein
MKFLTETEINIFTNPTEKKEEISYQPYYIALKKYLGPNYIQILNKINLTIINFGINIEIIDIDKILKTLSQRIKNNYFCSKLFGANFPADVYINGEKISKDLISLRSITAQVYQPEYLESTLAQAHQHESSGLRLAQAHQPKYSGLRLAQAHHPKELTLAQASQPKYSGLTLAQADQPEYSELTLAQSDQSEYSGLTSAQAHQPKELTLAQAHNPEDSRFTLSHRHNDSEPELRFPQVQTNN